MPPSQGDSAADPTVGAEPRHEPASRPPRMADVARVAGVSHQTVSRVLNDFPSIRPETRQRVLEAIEELGYRRNTAARTLVTRRSGTIGVITADMSHFGPANTMLGLEAASRAAGFNVALVGLPEITEECLRAAADRLLDQAVEALVVIVAHRAVLQLTQSLRIGVPVVVVEGDLSAMPLTAGVDQVEGARMATRHLLELGHETVEHLAGPAEWLEAAARQQGWRQALEEAGRPVPPVRLVGDWSSRSGYELGRRLVADGCPGAVFVANDQMALGLLRAAREAGLETPRDLSVVGFDDLPEAEYFCPPLTTIRQDFAELGRRTMEVILRALAGEHDAAVPLVEARLIVRESTAPPRR